MKVEAGAPDIGLGADGARCIAVMEPARRVGLVRRLVLREPDVAVDAEHRPLRIAADLGSEFGEPDVEILDQLAHRGADIVLVDVAMRLEPGLLIVAGELPEEAQRALVERHADKIMSWSADRRGKLALLALAGMVDALGVPLE